MNQTKRIEYIDISAGLMLAWMIFCHTSGFASVKSMPFLHFLQISFFMPYFFYKSGMFHSNKSITKDDIVLFAKKLLIPFVIFSLIGQAIYFVGVYMDDGLSIRTFVYRPIKNLYMYECVPGNGALWFLPTLFIIKVIAPILLEKVHYTILLAGGFGIAFACYLIHSIWIPCIIPNVATGMFFYVLGYKLRPIENIRWLFVIVLILYILWSASPLSGVYFHHNECRDIISYIAFFPCSLCGIVLLNNICGVIHTTLHISHGLFSWIGRNAMNLYVTHWIILVALDLVVRKIIGMTNVSQIFVIYVVTMMVSLPICNWIIKNIKQ